MASAVTSSSGSNPLGCLYQNLSTLLGEDPEKYKSFVRECTEELKVARSKPEPFACLEIEEKTSGRSIYVNLLVWPRVPSAGARNPGVLPLCGGVLGGASSQEDAGYGLNQFDVANVAIHDEESAAGLVGGASASVLLDFLEHRNPGRKLEFDRRGLKLPWIVMKDKYMGKLDQVEQSFEVKKDKKEDGEDEGQGKLVTPTTKSLIKTLQARKAEETSRGPPPAANNRQDSTEEIKIGGVDGGKGRVLIEEINSGKNDKGRRGRSEFDKRLRERMRRKEEEERKRKEREAHSSGILLREKRDTGDLLTAKVTRAVAGLSLSERPLFGRAVLKGGEEVRMKFFFPPMQGKEKPGPLKKEEILVEVAENCVRVQSRTGQTETAVVNPKAGGGGGISYRLESCTVSEAHPIATLTLVADKRNSSE